MSRDLISSVLILILFFFGFQNGFSQRIVFDSGHFGAVSENGIMRNAAELSHSDYQNKIVKSLEKINLNSAAVVAAQTMIYQGLSNVSAALKNGLMVKDMALTLNEVLSYSAQMVDLAKDDPILLLFSESMLHEMYNRGVALIGEVSSFVLNENQDFLMNYNARDELLKKIHVQLRILSGLSYGAWKAMYYAKMKGVFKTLNPFAAHLNQDRALVSQIISNAKYLKP